MLAGDDLSQALTEGNAVSAWKVERKGARSTPNALELELFQKISPRNQYQGGKDND